ncbi:Glycosyltransferase involved in cell wall bisynthesis [Faunimonas pinastri]|uniref:Glycosyltransferase involved in cell wall bisynthesis n=1 Tax=Faunimonas pinastri TaxID=1855383 RepID=A0A1H9FJP2_9HYPH|nr:glycosyltransferase [Faunimonas pinastri]SEQ38096.1 Glycosyltransferase involved in cell wall bisynthesis [Faunimonas pinastri]
MSLTVLSVAYPLAPVGPDAVGGSEQVLHALDEALVAAGHRSIVVAVDGSEVAGTLVSVPRRQGPLSNEVREACWPAHRAAIAEALDRFPVDVIHMHGLDFWGYLPPAGLPVLATLHLPISWYPEGSLTPDRPDTWLHCVSHAQHDDCTAAVSLLDPIENGVPVEALTAWHAKRGFALVLGRVCPEKGLHLAIDAARQADMSLLIAGEVFPYAEHERYFTEEIVPRLDRRRRFIGPIGFARKRRLLTAAQCLVVPSLVDETSSLVAREAAACGTPVVAFRKGALPKTVEHGRTGFIVDDLDEMAAAMRAAAELSPSVCRETARHRFSNEQMIGRYFEVYQRLAEFGAGRAMSAAQ